MAEDKTPNAISWMITPACADFLVSCADPRLIIVDAPDATVNEAKRHKLLKNQQLTLLGYQVVAEIHAQRGSLAPLMHGAQGDTKP